MTIASSDPKIADDIMSAKSIYALAGSLTAGLVLWMSVFALI
jgi:hypothetical protein